MTHIHEVIAYRTIRFSLRIKLMVNQSNFSKQSPKINIKNKRHTLSSSNLYKSNN